MVASSLNPDLLATPRELGLDVVLAAQTPPADSSMYSRHLAVDERDADAVTSAVRRLVAGGTRIDAVACFHEGSLHAAAAVAADLGLPGNSPEAVLAMRDKHRTCTVLAAAGVAAPRSLLVTSPHEAVLAAEKLGYPAVVKPRSSAASQGVTKVHNAEQAEAAYHAVDALHHLREFRRGEFAVPNIGHVYIHPDAQGVLVQEYVPGPEYAVDLVYGDGAFRVLAVHAKPSQFEGAHFIERTYLTPPERGDDESAAAETAVRALRAVGASVGGAHVEVRLSPDGPKVIEVNGRLGGTTAYVQESIRESTGAWGPLEYLRAVLGERPAAGDGRRPAGFTALLAEHTGRIERFVGMEQTQAIPGVLGIRWMARPGDSVVIDYAMNPVSCFALVLAAADTHQEVLRALELAEATLQPVMAARS